MAIVNLKDKGLNEVRKAYDRLRLEYDKAVTELNMAEKHYKTVMHSGTLSQKGMDVEKTKYFASKEKYRKTVESINKEFDKTVGETREHIRVLFSPKYEVRTSAFDDKMAQILKSGILSNDEIIAKAERYKAQDNITMYRYCASFIKNDDKMASDYARLSNYKTNATKPLERTDLTIFDGYSHILKSGLREDTTLADGIHGRIEEMTADKVETATNISVDTALLS